jgi:hypothetical protein
MLFYGGSNYWNKLCIYLRRAGFKLLKNLIAAGCELEKMSEDMSVALPILTKNEKLLRGLNVWPSPGFLRFIGFQSRVSVIRAPDHTCHYRSLCQ